jgi:hypothetical protein
MLYLHGYPGRAATPAEPSGYEELIAQLDPSETTEGPNHTAAIPGKVTPVEDAETRFRHSGWRERRDKTRDCMLLAGASCQTMNRFNNCGAAAWVMQDKNDPRRLRVQCERCRSRWCEACARERRTLIQMNLAKHLPKARLRFITLTLRSTDADVETQIKRLYSSFRKLRQRKQLKARLKGGIAFFELTFTPERNQFHPHLHIIYQGDYIAKELLSAQWHQVTGDSFIVDIRELPRPDHAIGYVAKYASKAIGSSVWKDTPAFVQVIQALKGVRTLFTFGCWKGFKLLEAPDSDVEWVTIGKLQDLVKRAAEGDRDAESALRRLNHYIPGNEHASDATLFDDG